MQSRLDLYVHNVYTCVVMNTAVINIKTEPETKQKAQKVASEIGVSLSSLINAYLKHLVKTRRVEFTLSEEPSDYLVKVLKQAEKNYKAGKSSPTFDNADDAIEWLHNKHVL